MHCDPFIFICLEILNSCSTDYRNHFALRFKIYKKNKLTQSIKLSFSRKMLSLSNLYFSKFVFGNSLYVPCPEELEVTFYNYSYLGSLLFAFSLWNIRIRAVIVVMMHLVLPLNPQLGYKFYL